MTENRTRPLDAPAPWWSTAVIYEVYPRSFADSDGDGVGDLAGIRQRLPYLESLGVHGIWLTPFQRSPQVDQGYDISDYCAVDPLFGTLAEFDALLADAHARGIHVLVDIVPNHTSTENELFQKALAAQPGSPERAMFHFVDSMDAAGLVPPNNWISVFGGSAWHRAHPASTTDLQWYLHLFSSAQPDWNWNNPAVVDYFDRVLRFWFDRGVDGIRIDVAHGLFKAPGLPDADSVPVVIDGLRSNPLAMDQEPVHAIYRRWRRLAQSYDRERLLVGEVNLEPQRAGRYTRPDELHQTFAFAFARLGWDQEAWVSVGSELERVRVETGADPSWALENHDLVRTVTRFGGGELGAARARAAIVALLGLPGSAYVFQGQELGLPEIDVPLADRADPMWTRGGVSRDGARVPLPWDPDPAGAFGFSPVGPTVGSGVGYEVGSGVGPARPWLPQPEGWGDWAVSKQLGDAASTLSVFTGAMRSRAELVASGVFRAGAAARWSGTPDGRVMCERQGGVTVVVAMGDAAVPLPPGRPLLTSAPLVAGLLPPNAAAWVQRS
ncbi:alpha-amylase family glycosyl hydrolase [Marisediminicola senii]|uniref:alpha-amylase family glycosyl hydrolase n=1 Tax=Marisediminicola senii TaxID=2711233 RepID=UPI0013EE3E31|nr:alpha-amylase family glycosyl hydrolase [Marisediminicola senii]